jgi:chaperonin GroEL (HSP60 family)
LSVSLSPRKHTGIVDPAKVTRSALQNAASIASMLLTTEARGPAEAGEGEAGRSGRRWDAAVLG